MPPIPPKGEARILIPQRFEESKAGEGSERSVAFHSHKPACRTGTVYFGDNRFSTSDRLRQAAPDDER
jgi:hypothetical protein